MPMSIEQAAELIRPLLAKHLCYTNTKVYGYGPVDGVPEEIEGQDAALVGGGPETVERIKQETGFGTLPVELERYLLDFIPEWNVSFSHNESYPLILCGRGIISPWVDGYLGEQPDGSPAWLKENVILAAESDEGIFFVEVDRRGVYQSQQAEGGGYTCHFTEREGPGEHCPVQWDDVGGFVITVASSIGNFVYLLTALHVSTWGPQPRAWFAGELSRLEPDADELALVFWLNTAIREHQGATLGERLWSARHGRNTVYFQAAAAHLGVKPSQVLLWEHDHGRPSLEQLQALAELYETGLEALEHGSQSTSD